MGGDYANISLMGAVVRTPEQRVNANEKPFLDVSFAGEHNVSGLRGEHKTLPWYLTVRLQGRWLEHSPKLTAGAVALVNGTLEQWVKNQEQPNDLQSRIVPRRLELVTDYPSAMMLEDKTGGLRFPGGINSGTLIGNLTRDPEFKQVEGQPLVKLAMAVNTASSLESKKTVYLQLDAWGEFGQRCKTLHRGSRVLVIGWLSLDRSLGESPQQPERQRLSTRAPRCARETPPQRPPFRPIPRRCRDGHDPLRRYKCSSYPK